MDNNAAQLCKFKDMYDNVINTVHRS